MRIDTFKKGDRVTHPKIYWSTEIMTITGFRPGKVRLKGYWSEGMGFDYEAEGWVEYEGLKLYTGPPTQKRWLQRLRGHHD